MGTTRGGTCHSTSNTSVSSRPYHPSCPGGRTPTVSASEYTRDVSRCLSWYTVLGHYGRMHLAMTRMSRRTNTPKEWYSAYLRRHQYLLPSGALFSAQPTSPGTPGGRCPTDPWLRDATRIPSCVHICGHEGQYVLHTGYVQDDDVLHAVSPRAPAVAPVATACGIPSGRTDHISCCSRRTMSHNEYVHGCILVWPRAHSGMLHPVVTVASRHVY